MSSTDFSARYSVGMMMSVSMSSPSTQMRAVNVSAAISHTSRGGRRSAVVISPAMAEAVTVSAEPR